MDDSALPVDLTRVLVRDDGLSPKLAEGHLRVRRTAGRRIRLPCPEIHADVLAVLLNGGLLRRLGDAQVEITIRGIGTLFEFDPPVGLRCGKGKGSAS